MNFTKFNWRRNWKLSIAIFSVLFLATLCNSNTSENYSSDGQPGGEAGNPEYGSYEGWHPDDPIGGTVDYNYSN